MNEEEALEQLYSLIDDRKAFIKENSEDNEIFRRDLVALETIIDSYQHDKICLSGYRESILRRIDTNLDLVEDIIEENKQLKEQAEKLEERYRVRSKSYNNILLENAKLYDQLKQRDEVIAEAKKQAKFIDEQLRKYVTPITSKEVADLFEILQM